MPKPASIQLADDDVPGPRVELAVARLHGGHALRFRGMLLGMADAQTLECAIASSVAPDSANDESARADLRQAHIALGRLREHSHKLNLLCVNCELQFVLMDGYTADSAELCRLQGKELLWAPGFGKACRVTV
jgi:hypothetical protein